MTESDWSCTRNYNIRTLQACICVQINEILTFHSAVTRWQAQSYKIQMLGAQRAWTHGVWVLTAEEQFEQQI